MHEPTLRPGAAGDEAAILALLERSLGGERSPEFHRWKHHDNPYGASYVRVAEVGGVLAAWRAFLRWSWQAGGRRMRAVRAVDTATGPDYRRRGLFSRLTADLVDEARADGVSLVFNTPGPKSLPGYRKLGWRVVGRVPLLVRPLRPTRLGWRLLTARARGGGARDPNPSVNGFPPVQDLLAAEGLRELCAAAAEGPRLTTERTFGYIFWRYRAIPGFDYRALWMLGDEGRAAIIFHAARRRGLSEIKVSEVLTAPSPAGRKAASRLLRRLAGGVDADYLVACAPPRSPERAALLRAGFLPARRLGPLLTALPLRPDASLPDPCRMSSWRLSLGDLEIF